MAELMEKKPTKKALFKSYNLLGDGLQTGPAMRQFKEVYGDQVEITVGTDDNYIGVIYERMGVGAKVLRMPEDELPEDDYDFVWRFDITRAFRLNAVHDLPCSQVFGVMLGLDILDPLPVYEVPEDEQKIADQLILGLTPEKVEAQPLVLFQPYSISCSSWTGERPNKRWPDQYWAETYRRIKEEFGVEVKVLGGRQDKKNYPIPGIPLMDHWFGLPLDTVAALQKRAEFILTLDSGVAHLAASQKARMLEFYPDCLSQRWMSNLDNPNSRIIYARPEEIPVDYVWQFVREDLAGIRKEESCITK